MQNPVVARIQQDNVIIVVICYKEREGLSRWKGME